VSLGFCRSATHLRQADVVIIPGSKQTVDDLLWMRMEGLDLALLDYARSGLVLGICGGMQMLGEQILDPHGMETSGSIAGLGLLPIQTTMQSNKITEISTGQLVTPSLFGQAIPGNHVSGYEIHIGETLYLKEPRPFAQLARRSRYEQLHRDGCITPDSRIFGTYLHGIFDEDGFRHTFIAAARDFYHLAPAAVMNQWKKKREDSLNRLAVAVGQSLDIPRIFDWVGLAYRPQSLMENGERSH
jgi:adenosylcobyric acid synthase